MNLSNNNNCIITRSNPKHVTSHNVLGNPCPFLMQSNCWRFPGCIERSRMHRQSSSHSCSIGVRSGLTKLTRFVLSSAHTWLPRQRGSYQLLDDVNWLRLEREWKPIVFKRVIFRNDPLSIQCHTAWTGLIKTVTVFNNLMQNWLLKKMISNIFSFLNNVSIITPKSDWWVSFVIEYITHELLKHCQRYNYNVWNSIDNLMYTGVALMTQLRTCLIKIVKFKGGHLLW